VLFVTLFAAVDLLLYMYWNAPRAAVIAGLQGRYYLPLAALLLLPVYGCIRFKIGRLRQGAALMPLLIVVLLFSLFTLLRRFY
ncbi:MAG TPA: hypothetical protein VKQ34_02330, partial [Candidatus Saccharimonadales bacterium]|nr:hypothetical protein [Candidatus Saccharimonadales bacterium]